SMNEPVKRILDFFEQINAIPRCSKKEKEIGRWLEQWGATNGFAVKKDLAGNLLIRVPASAGFEQAPVIVIQGHMDMVCEKSPDSAHNFDKDPICHIYDGDWLRADHTTLGADNGIALALCTALVSDPAVVHPPLELLFTVNEETGLNGAKKIEPDLLQGQVFLNIDSETEGVFTVGCAGGRHTLVSLALNLSEKLEAEATFKLSVHGLKGGHSGIDIHKQRANANLILARALHHVAASCDLRLVTIKGGSAHNAIPRDAFAVFACRSNDTTILDSMISEFERTVKAEYGAAEPALAVALTAIESEPQAKLALNAEQTVAVINLLLAIPHGVSGMSAIFEDLVETSNNLATVEMSDSHFRVLTSQRSSVISRLEEATNRIKAIAALAGAEAQSDGEYPPWTPDMNSALLKRCNAVYERLFDCKAKIMAIHAGLECAVIGAKYADMDMISFGPDIENPHSPAERLFIPSLERVWDFMVALLKSYGSS
ncbi:MAG: aminoacyl-histidine dipeptidase, partial [Desulfobacterales bacterium]